MNDQPYVMTPEEKERWKHIYYQYVAARFTGGGHADTPGPNIIDKWEEAYKDDTEAEKGTK